MLVPSHWNGCGKAESLPIGHMFIETYGLSSRVYSYGILAFAEMYMVTIWSTMQILLVDLTQLLILCRLDIIFGA